MFTFCGDTKKLLSICLSIALGLHQKLLAFYYFLVKHLQHKIDKFDEVTILFGISDNNPENCLLNHIIIIGKHSICTDYYIGFYNPPINFRAISLATLRHVLDSFTQ